VTTQVAVFVVSRTRLYREGIAAALREHFTVVGAAADLEAAVGRLKRLAADVVLLDHAIPEGARAVIALRDHSPARVLAVAASERETDVIPWAEAGAAGFLGHDASLDELISAVAAVAAGRAACSPHVAAVLLSRVAMLADARRPGPALGDLTQREREVAELLERGLSNKEIATHLTIEVATVKNHVHNVLEKLQVRRRGEAASLLRTRAI
jgi:two-component system, NarL family, nitrate/nitrite response regulator NarL